MSSVEVVVGRFYRVNAYGWWKNVVKRGSQIGFWNGGLQPHGSDLPERMNPGVGAARTLRQHILSCEPIEAVGESALQGLQAGLNLPPVKLRPVIGQRDFQSATHISSQMSESAIVALCKALLSRVKRPKSALSLSYTMPFLPTCEVASISVPCEVIFEAILRNSFLGRDC